MKNRVLWMDFKMLDGRIKLLEKPYHQNQVFSPILDMNQLGFVDKLFHGKYFFYIFDLMQSSFPFRNYPVGIRQNEKCLSYSLVTDNHVSFETWSSIGMW